MSLIWKSPRQGNWEDVANSLLDEDSFIWKDNFIFDLLCENNANNFVIYILSRNEVLWIYRALLHVARVTSSLPSMAARRMARVLLPLAWVKSSLLSYGWTLYSTSIIAFGLGYLTFVIVWLYVVWREYYCLWPRLIHRCRHMAVRRMAWVLLPLAWLTSFLPSYGCTSYGASIVAFALGYFIFVIIWLYAIWREYYCLWPGLPQLYHRMAVRCTVRVLLPLAWVDSSWSSYGCISYGASMIAFGVDYLILAIVWLYVVWLEYYCFWPGLI